MPMFPQIIMIRSAWLGNAFRPWRFFLCVLLALNIPSPLYAASFTIVDGQEVTAPQVLNANETAIIEAGGKLKVVDADAIRTNVGADNVTINNNGIITVTMTGGIVPRTGITVTGTNAFVTNSGSITVLDVLSGPAINVNRANATVINSGTIMSIGSGILSSDVNAIIINSGTITTTGTGFDGSGIDSSGSNISITNSGTIKTTGNNADGILAFAANASITNSGSISVTGTGAIGISLDDVGADNNVLTNSGLILASGNATQAIRGGTGINVVNIQTGSQILGSINLGGGTDAFNVRGMPLASSHMTLQNVETITLAAGLPGVIIGNTVTTVDPSMQTVQGTALSNLTSAFHNVISQRMAHTRPLPPVQLASLELSPGMLFQERAPVVWGDVFGSHRSRGDDDLALAYTHNYKGFTGGYEQDYDKARVGVFAGFAVASVETDVTSLQTNTDSYFGGGYAHFYLGPVNLTTSLAVGVEDHENDRTVIDNLFGVETARSDFSSVFFSPSVTLSAAYKLNEYYEFRPSATLTYNVAWYNSYTETGTTRSNLSIDNRTDHALTGRVQLAMAVAPNETSEFEFRTGVITRYTNHDNVKASLAGTSFQYAATGDSTVPGAFVGGNLRFNVTDKLDLMGDVEYIGASGNESDISARLRVEYSF